MKFLNYASVALATLPTCAGQGSLRVVSKLAPLEDNLEARAQAHLDVLFDDARRNLARRRRLHRLAVDSEMATEDAVDKTETEFSKELKEYKEETKKFLVDIKKVEIQKMVTKGLAAKEKTAEVSAKMKAEIRNKAMTADVSAKMKAEIRKKMTRGTGAKLWTMAGDGDAVGEVRHFNTDCVLSCLCETRL
jgi:hypothetical protein